MSECEIRSYRIRLCTKPTTSQYISRFGPGGKVSPVRLRGTSGDSITASAQLSLSALRISAIRSLKESGNMSIVSR